MPRIVLRVVLLVMLVPVSMTSVGAEASRRLPTVRSAPRAYVVVPRVTGLSVDRALVTVASHDLCFGSIHRVALGTTDRVVRQSPKPGRRVRTFSAVALWVVLRPGQAVGTRSSTVCHRR